MMHLSPIYLSSICPFLLFCFMIIRAFLYPKSPPGPWKLPLLGHLHHLRGLPHHALCNLAKKHGTLLMLRFGEIDALIVSSPSAAKEILQTHDLAFVNRPAFVSAGIISYNYTNIGFSPYGDYWRQLRKICTMELLSAKKVHSMWSIREEEVSNLIRNISSSAMSGSSVNLSHALASLMSDIISRIAFGDKCKDRDAVVSLVKDMTSLVGGFDIADLFPSLTYLHWISGTKRKLQKVHEKFDMFLENILNDHEQKKQTSKSKHEEDIVDVFLRLQEEKSLEIPLERNNIKAVVMDMFGGGTDTSSTALVWAMAELMRNPKVIVKAQDEVRSVFNGKSKISQSDIDELSYMHMVIKETLRLYPPFPLLTPRESRERCMVGGYDIAKGTKEIVNAWKLGRDPDSWPNPERFEPERFQDLSVDYSGTNFSYLPFGAGRRKCPGISLGLANIELVLAQLLYHFDWKLSDSDELDMTEAFGVTVNKKVSLNLLPTVYHP